MRISEERITQLLDKLDKAVDLGATARREHTRYRYRRTSITARLQQPGDATPAGCLVHTRDVSSAGAAFLHGCFVHTGSHCELQLVTLHGSWENVAGKVVSCRYVEGNIHEVSMQFDQAIDPSLFAAEAAPCRVLLVDDDLAVARLAKFHFAQLNADIEHVENGEIAIEKALANPFDMILLDVHLPDMNGTDVVAVLRSKGYTGLVAAFCSLNKDEDRAIYLKAGFDKHVPKPASREDFAKLLEEIRDEPVHSVFHNDLAMAEIIDAFVAELPAVIRAIETATIEHDLGTLAHAVRSLAESAGGYGFEVLTDAANAAKTVCLGEAPREDIQHAVERLVRLCRLARGHQDPGQAKKAGNPPLAAKKDAPVKKE